MTQCIYAGLLVSTSNGEEDGLLGLMSKGNNDWHTEILADRISRDMYFGRFLTVSYFISDKQLSKNELTEEYLKALHGWSDAKYSVRYSDITGYLWTDEEINVGGHNLLEELKSYISKWLYMEISFFKSNKKGE